MPDREGDERQLIADFILREARTRYSVQGKADVEEALERIAQLILRGEHRS